MGGGTVIIGNDALRRMVARTLRGRYLVRDIGGYAMTRGTLFGMHLVAKNEIDLRNATKSLGELIDPVAAPTSMDDLGNPPYNTFGLHLNGSVNGCNVCGYPFGINRYPGMGMPSTIPRYCPYCGTRQDVHYCKEETPDVDK